VLVLFSLFAGGLRRTAADGDPKIFKQIAAVSDSIGRYEKFEAKIDLDATVKNPYDPTEIKVDFIFLGVIFIGKKTSSDSEFIRKIGILGVGGNASCRELLRYVHCRNCPVYSAAAVQLLDRPLSDDHRREWTNHYAQEKKLVPQSGTKKYTNR